MSMSRKRKSGLSDDFVVDDEDDNTPKATSTRPSKKSKPSGNTSGNGNGSTSLHFSSAASQLPRSSTSPQTDDEGNSYWEISRARRVTLSSYRGKQMVSIREYYEKDGKWLPGKKGISMTVEQYSALLGVVPAVHEMLRQKGEEPVRVSYDGGHEDGQAGEVEEDERVDDDDGGGRPNYADTDEED